MQDIVLLGSAPVEPCECYSFIWVPLHTAREILGTSSETNFPPAKLDAKAPITHSGELKPCTETEPKVGVQPSNSISMLHFF